jgi:hypothetical protein
MSFPERNAVSTRAKYPCITPEQKTAEMEFEAFIADQARADTAYNALENSRGGRVISTDLARELDPVYANWSVGQPPRDLAPSWGSAWIYAQGRFARELSKLGKNELVRFMAGGWAAGKSRVVEHLEQSGEAPAKLTWDGTLGDRKWARVQIRNAIERGCRVDILYVHRNIELAMYGAIDRARNQGRLVPLKELPKNHRDVQRAVRRLITDFREEENVSFSFLHNIGSKVGTTELDLAPMPFEEEELAPTGALHYRESHEGYYREASDEIEAVCG